MNNVDGSNPSTTPHLNTMLSIKEINLEWLTEHQQQRLYDDLNNFNRGRLSKSQRQAFMRFFKVLRTLSTAHEVQALVRLRY